MPEAAIAEGLKTPGSSKGAEMLKHAFIGLGQTDPRAAVERLGMIQDPKLRGELLEAGLTAWVRNDPEAATAWLRARSRAVPQPVVLAGSDDAEASVDGIDGGEEIVPGPDLYVGHVRAPCTVQCA